MNVREILGKTRDFSRNLVNKTTSLDFKKSSSTKNKALSFRDHSFLNKHLKIKLPALEKTNIFDLS